MQIVDFAPGHVQEALQIVRRNYEEERGFVPALPPGDRLPDLRPYAENGLGAAALEGGRMAGFLCSVPPFGNAFGSTSARGVFSPMGANGATGENRAGTYARLYRLPVKNGRAPGRPATPYACMPTKGTYRSNSSAMVSACAASTRSAAWA